MPCASSTTSGPASRDSTPGTSTAWVRLSTGLPVVEVALDSIREVDSNYWFDDRSGPPTVREVVEHVRLVQEVDPSYPIILGFDGRVMDGMHRVARALLDCRSTIRAVRFETHPEPTTATASPTTSPTQRHRSGAARV